MIIERTLQEKHINHKVIIGDGLIYYRNEYLKYNSHSKEWCRMSMDWVVGNKEGKGPYKTPINHVELERDFLLTMLNISEYHNTTNHST